MPSAACVETCEDPTEHPERGSDPDSRAQEEITKELVIQSQTIYCIYGNISLVLDSKGMLSKE